MTIQEAIRAAIEQKKELPKRFIIDFNKNKRSTIDSSLYGVRRGSWLNRNFFIAIPLSYLSNEFSGILSTFLNERIEEGIEIRIQDLFADDWEVVDYDKENE